MTAALRGRTGAASRATRRAKAATALIS